MSLSRRASLALPLAAPAFAQADTRPVLTIAVQKISNTNTMEPLREQSNVGSRTWFNHGETLIEQDWWGDLGLRPGLATAWRRIDERSVELTLRQGVKMHDGREMTAEDVQFSFGPDRMGWNMSTDQARNLFGVISYLQREAGVALRVEGRRLFTVDARQLILCHHNQSN